MSVISIKVQTMVFTCTVMEGPCHCLAHCDIIHFSRLRLYLISAVICDKKITVFHRVTLTQIKRFGSVIKAYSHASFSPLLSKLQVFKHKLK